MTNNEQPDKNEELIAIKNGHAKSTSFDLEREALREQICRVPTKHHYGTLGEYLADSEIDAIMALVDNSIAQAKQVQIKIIMVQMSLWGTPLTKKQMVNLQRMSDELETKQEKQS